MIFFRSAIDQRPRPNEVGNDIEPFVAKALNDLGYEAGKPKTKGGKGKTTAYPDLYFIDGAGRLSYLECKTFNIKNVDTTQRSFYLSPSEDSKVSADAHHFVLSFEIYVAGRKGSNNISNVKVGNCWRLRNSMSM